METKRKCDYCKSKTRQVKAYIIADNLEEPRFLCKECKKKLDMAVMMNYLFENDKM